MPKYKIHYGRHGSKEKIVTAKSNKDALIKFADLDLDQVEPYRKRKR